MSDQGSAIGAAGETRGASIPRRLQRDRSSAAKVQGCICRRMLALAHQVCPWRPGGPAD